MPHARINGARLWYDIEGPVGAAPILLHHGYTASRVNWLPVAERLAARFRVILMECRGTGESEHTVDGYTLEQYATDVVGMADHIGLERFTYAGHSMGGGVGYVLGLDHAARLDRLVLMAPIGADGIASDPAQRAQWRRWRAARDRAAMLAQYRAGRIRTDVETDAWFESRIDHILSVSDGHYEGGFAAMQALRAGHRLASLTTPTLMIAAAGDGLLRANLADFERLPNATLHVFSRAGHEVAVHEPDGVASAIATFMADGLPRPVGARIELSR
jgi:pimeloyl-ACP methyl ester carboxylesterase